MTWFKQAPTNFKKFDSREELLEDWFCHAETVGRIPTTGQPDERQTMEGAILYKDYDIKNNLAIFISGDQSVMNGTSWSKFKDTFRSGISERQLRDVFTPVGQWPEMKLNPGPSSSTFLDMANKCTEMMITS